MLRFVFSFLQPGFQTVPQYFKNVSGCPGRPHPAINIAIVLISIIAKITSMMAV
jgi:hypothetical protein